MKIPKEIREFAKIYRSNGFKCYLVGGAVRNILMKKGIEDYDMATDAKPAETKRLFKRVVNTGIKHGTVTVFFKGFKIEVTTFRVEYQYSDGRHPDKVEFVPSIYEDLKRRDFTINSIAYDPLEDRIIDPHGGMRDIKSKIIRAIGNPEERFKEDGLRLLRACRFSSQLGFKIEENTQNAIKVCHEYIGRISAERIRDELVKILATEKPSKGILCMKDTGLLSEVIPELDSCVDVEQREMHCYDVFFHSIYTCDAAPSDDMILRLAALFHDIGKPDSLFINEHGEPRFHNHEIIGAEKTERIMKRLKFSNQEISSVKHLIMNHMFNYSEEWSDAAVRRFIARVREENIPRLLALRRADQIGRCNRYFISENLIRFEERIKRVLKEKNVFSRKDLAIDGNDIMQYLGIKEGRMVGIILNYLFETVLESPDANSRQTLLEIAERFYRERLKPDKVD